MVKIAKRGFIVNTVDTEVCSRFRVAIHLDHLAFEFWRMSPLMADLIGPDFMENSYILMRSPVPDNIPFEAAYIEKAF